MSRSISAGVKLWLARSEQDTEAVQAEVLAALARGRVSFRDLARNSQFWQSQIACALARLMKAGKVRRVAEGRYQLSHCYLNPAVSICAVADCIQ